jgi:hypothetical protein
LALARGQEVKISQLFEGFSYFIDALLTYLLMCLFILLWLLLLIIPGIVATYSYSMAFYIETFAKLYKTSNYVIPHVPFRVAKAGIQYHQGFPRFPRIKYGAGLVKPGMTNKGVLQRSHIIGNYTRAVGFAFIIMNVSSACHFQCFRKEQSL